jgi:hypothetical protein
MFLVALLILVIFLTNCDNAWIRTIKNKIPGFAKDIVDDADNTTGAAVNTTCAVVDVAGAVVDAAGDGIDGAINDAIGDSSGVAPDDTYSLQDELSENALEPFSNNRASPNTWEPSTVEFDGSGTDAIYRTYAEDLKSNVDAVIVESHQEYTEDAAYLASTGASHASARDDFMPAVQFHGLPRSAHYMNLGATMGARTGQSETPDTVIDLSIHNSAGYAL